MIVFTGAHARSAMADGKRSPLVGVTFSWERGVLAVLGAPVDGTLALLEAAAGMTRIRAGTVTIAGGDPAAGRTRIAYVPLASSLPDALRVDEVCDLAGALRREPAQTPAARLAVLGLEALAKRRVRSLSACESRAVSLALALSSKASVLLVEEPFVGLDGPAPARVVEALRARATAGAAVLVTTASVRDATRLGDQLGVLTQGVFAHLPASRAHVGQGGAKLRVVIRAESATDVAPFVAVLVQEAAIVAVETSTYLGTRVMHAAVAVVVSGPELLEVARAVARAAARSDAKVLAIESAVQSLASLRSPIVAALPAIAPPPPAPALGPRSPPPADAAPPSAPEAGA